MTRLDLSQARRLLTQGLVLLALVLAGCGSDPTRTLLTVNASAQLNPNSENQPSPTVVRIYGLKNSDAFTNATFFQIFEADRATLGADLLSRREVVLEPGQTMQVDSTEEPGTRFVGILAAFRQLNGANWRAMLPVSAGDDNALVVTLQTSAVTLKPKPSRFLGIF